jgi:hypothetical protein
MINRPSAKKTDLLNFIINKIEPQK